jgi:hypothetical protein
VKADVEVAPGRLTEVDAWLAGEFTELEEFVVQDFLISGSEAALLQMRFEAPSLMDSISAELIGRAGASDAASALNLVAGATVQDGKFAVIRGLPDRYVVSQLNGVRLPTADEDKRAVELDQFPSAVIESIQVSKTFTPDQQGDASGGAVNVVLKGIPDEAIFQLKGQVSRNTQVAGRKDFLTYEGGGLTRLGKDNDSRAPQLGNLGGNWDGAVGVSEGESPTDYKWSTALGGKHELDNGLTLGGFASFFYERDSAFFNRGIDDSLWVEVPGEGLVPQTVQGSVADGDFKTALFDVTQGSQSVQWGGLGSLGIENDRHSLGMTYLYTHTAEDTATLAEDTRGKEFFFPGYDPDDPDAEGNSPANLTAAPFIRTETLEYTERTVTTLQWHGEHKLPFDDIGVDGVLKFLEPEVDWTVSRSSADLDQPDKRQFGSLFVPASTNPGFPPFIPPFTTDPVQVPFKPAANFTLGNLQRIFKEIDETSDQLSLNCKWGFEQWTGDEGFVKVGLFDDQVKRKFNQDTFSNFGDGGASFAGTFDQFWSEVFPSEDHPITDGPPFVDVDYRGEQDIAAWYAMTDLPITSFLSLVGGYRFESTELSVINLPEEDATWFPPGASTPVTLNPGDADVFFSQDDVLPSIATVITPFDSVTFRMSYAETIARQTFKELTPILQQEFLGGDVFIGNPELTMSGLRNYDMRLDYTPYDGGLVSVSWFKKDIDRPIEYVQRVAGFTFTTPVNYPSGELRGYELEMRQNLGHFWEGLDGLAVGANATFIDARVQLPDDEIAAFSAPNIQAPRTSRDMTAAPEHLYNLYLTYDLEATGTQAAIFYTVKGDTLVAGAGESDGNFVPDVYALEYGTLNFSLSQRLGKYFKLQFQAKNLTDPSIEEVYRSEFIGSDVTKTKYTKGVEYSIGLSAEILF